MLYPALAHFARRRSQVAVGICQVKVVMSHYGVKPIHPSDSVDKKPSIYIYTLYKYYLNQMGFLSSPSIRSLDTSHPDTLAVLPQKSFKSAEDMLAGIRGAGESILIIRDPPDSHQEVLRTTAETEEKALVPYHYIVSLIISLFGS